MICRAYQSNDLPKIEALFFSAFADAEGEAEGKLIANLVRELMSYTDPNDLRGFISGDGKDLVGAIFFSRLIFEENDAVFMLSPVAVGSKHQKKGVGRALIMYGLQALQREGVDLVVTYGDPAFYGRAGFCPLSEELVKAPYNLSRPEGWLGQSLKGDPIQPLSSRGKCVKAFNNPAYW